MRGSLASATRRIACCGAVVIGLGGAAVGMSVQAPAAHAAPVPVTVYSTSGPSIGFGGGIGASVPTDTGQDVGPGTGAITISTDSSKISLVTPFANPVEANGLVSGTGPSPYPTPGAGAAYSGVGAVFGQLLYRIGAFGTIQPVFTTQIDPGGVIGPVTIPLPPGHNTGRLYLFVNDTYYPDNLKSFSASVTLLAAPAVTKAFTASTVASGVPNTLTFTISNPNTDATGTLSNIAFSDPLLGNLPAGNVLGIVLYIATTTCTSYSTLSTTSNGIGSSLAVTGLNLAPGASCTVTTSVTYTLTPNTPAQTVTNTVGGTYTVQGVDNPFAPATASQIITPALVRLVNLCGDNQTTPANTAFAKPLVVQAQDASGAGLNGVNLTFTVTTAPGINGAGASFPPVPPTTTTTTVTTATVADASTLAGCGLSGPLAGVAVIDPVANGIPSVTGQTYTITVTPPAGIVPTSTPVPFMEANGRQLATDCSTRVALTSAAGVTLSLAVGTPALNPTRIAYLVLGGTGGTLRARPLARTLVCQLAYTFGATRLPLQADFNALVLSSSALGVVAPTMVHVTVTQDLGAATPVQTVVISSFNAAAPSTAGTTLATFTTAGSITTPAFQIRTL